MKRGDAFSDISTAMAGSLSFFAGAGYYQNFSVCDLQKDKIRNFFNVRSDIIFQNLAGKISEEAIIELSILHGNIESPFAPNAEIPSAEDIIGPVNEDRIPIIGTNGEWKIIKTIGEESVTTMGNKVYSLGYIGNKRYIRIGIEVKGPAGTILELFSVINFITGLYAHAGKGYDRYNILKTDGGQIK